MRCPDCGFDNSDVPIICASCDSQFGALGDAVIGAMWQPMESAPKDGTAILGWDGFGSPTSIYWGAKQYRPRWELCVGEIVGGNDSTAYEPTHWMPLPEPPATA